MVNVKRSSKSIERNSEIGARFKYLRENMGLTQRQIAKRLNPPTTSQTVCKWENGTVVITVDRIEQLAKIYRVNPAELLGYK